MTNIPSEIGGRLRSVRSTLGLSQAALAEKTESGRSTIQQYENGDSIPGGLFLRSLAALGISVHWLLTGEGEPMRGQGEPLSPPSSQTFLDLELLGTVAADFARELKRRRLDLSPEQFSQMLVAFYRVLSEDQIDGRPYNFSKYAVLMR